MTLSNVSSKNYVLSQYITEIPANKSSALHAQAGWNRTASKVCTAALLAIMGVAITISFGIAVPIPPALLISCIIGTAPLSLASKYFQDHSQKCTRLAQIAEGQEASMKQVENWTSQDIKNFLQSHQILESNLPLKELAKLRPDEPLCALLPAIAKYHYWYEQTKAHLLRYKANIHNQSQDPTLKTLGRSQAWSILEDKALPAALQAAFMLQIIRQPALQIEWEQLGQCQPKTFEQRIFDRWIDRSDDYFIFNQPNHPPITLKELCALLNPLNIDGIRATYTRA